MWRRRGACDCGCVSLLHHACCLSLAARLSRLLFPPIYLTLCLSVGLCLFLFPSLSYPDYILCACAEMSLHLLWRFGFVAPLLVLAFRAKFCLIEMFAALAALALSVSLLHATCDCLSFCLTRSLSVCLLKSLLTLSVSLTVCLPLCLTLCLPACLYVRHSNSQPVRSVHNSS